MDPPDPPHRASASNAQLDPDADLEWAGGAIFSSLRVRIGGDSRPLTNRENKSEVVLLVERFCSCVEDSAKAQGSDQRRINHDEH
jgi:hypothetical protein